jgi:hypothetical protein
MLISSKFAGVIPAELSQLRCLKVLRLDNNRLTGISYKAAAACNDADANVGNIPVELSQLSSLYNLNLSVNELSGKLFHANC